MNKIITFDGLQQSNEYIAKLLGEVTGNAEDWYEEMATKKADKEVVDGIVSSKGEPGGYAALDSSGKIPTQYLPSYVDDVIEGTINEDLTVFTVESDDSGADNGHYEIGVDKEKKPETGKIYVDTETGRTYRWGGSKFVEISKSLALGETSSTAFPGDKGQVAYEHANAKGKAVASDFYKITTNDQGHVTGATKVTKTDLIDLGAADGAIVEKLQQSIGQPDGIASLGSNGKIPQSQLPNNIGDGEWIAGPDNDNDDEYSIYEVMSYTLQKGELMRSVIDIWTPMFIDGSSELNGRMIIEADYRDKEPNVQCYHAYGGRRFDISGDVSYAFLTSENADGSVKIDLATSKDAIGPPTSFKVSETYSNLNNSWVLHKTPILINMSDGRSYSLITIDPPPLSMLYNSLTATINKIDNSKYIYKSKAVVSDYTNLSSVINNIKGNGTIEILDHFGPAKITSNCYMTISVPANSRLVLDFTRAAALPSDFTSRLAGAFFRFELNEGSTIHIKGLQLDAPDDQPPSWYLFSLNKCSGTMDNPATIILSDCSIANWGTYLWTDGTFDPATYLNVEIYNNILKPGGFRIVDASEGTNLVMRANIHHNQILASNAATHLIIEPATSIFADNIVNKTFICKSVLGNTLDVKYNNVVL